MKTWNIPSLEELNVDMTASGAFPDDYEQLDNFFDLPVVHLCCFGDPDAKCECHMFCENHVDGPHNGGSGSSSGEPTS